LAFLAFQVVAQTNTPTFIKGEMDIQYNSRITPQAVGIKDVYTLNINVSNSAVFKGSIKDTPLIMGGWTGGTIKQAKSLEFDVACDVVNPKNPAQSVNVGRIFGKVGIDQDGTYRYDSGAVQMSILPRGNAVGFDSKFAGITVGKPLARPANWMETLKRETVNIKRKVGGKIMTVALKRYDKMEFRQHVIAAGPIQMYQPVTVNGEALYDYDKFSWFFNNITVQYVVNNTVKIDRLSGNIRWVETPNRKVTGEGEYQFDIRVNEPPPSENAVFTASEGDESDFFETDTTLPALVGTMKYKDVLKGDTTTSSKVTIDLTGNNLTKQQVMVLCKMVIFSMIAPMNSD